MQSQAFDRAIYIVYDLILDDINLAQRTLAAKWQCADRNQTFNNARRTIAIATRL